MLVGLPVSAIIYLLACRSLDLEAELKIIAVKDEGLDGPAIALEERTAAPVSMSAPS
jgi:hypothetical protein